MRRSLDDGLRWAIGAVVLGLLLGPVAVAAADVIVLRDGDRLVGELLSVDADHVVVRNDRGTTRIPRDRVSAIHLGDDALLPPLKIELRSLAADDQIEVLLDDTLILRAGREPGGWIDVTDALKDGNNRLRLRIHNERGIWAYRLSFRVNGQATTVGCGTPRDTNRPCECCGKSGREIGVIDDLPDLWLHVDRKAGTAEVLP